MKRKSRNGRVLVGAPHPAVLIGVAVFLGASLPANPNVPCVDGVSRILVHVPEKKLEQLMGSAALQQLKLEIWHQKGTDPATLLHF
ncbi:MAG: hypothetical protein V4438_02045 [Patescibacteria group bacterium]